MEILEDYAYVLDYLVHGHPDARSFKREPIAIGLGKNEFKILELIPKSGVIINIGDKVYIGKDITQRDEILHVKRRISYNDMTTTAQRELPYIILEIVKEDEPRFVKFFNEAQPISTRFHMLELLPGLGKKTMWAVIEERKKSPFKNFEDLTKRIHGLKQPEKLIAKRIELELTDPNQKYRIFVPP